MLGQLKKNGKPSFLEHLEVIYSQHLLLIWLLIIFLPIIIISIGCIILPELFYDEFIWKYFWGTIEADAQEESYGEVTEAYNPVNTIFYGFIVIIVLYWTYKLFKKFKIELDFKFFIAIIPFIFVGGVSRALEDAELFFTPMAYFFIAPIIYIFIGIVVIGLIVIGVLIKKVSTNRNLQTGLLLIGGCLIVQDIIYLFIYFLLHNQFSYILHPIVPVTISILILVGLWKYIEYQKKFEISIFLFSMGLWFLTIGTIVILQWQSISSWTQAYNNANPGSEVQLQPLAFLLVMGLTIFSTFIIYFIAKALAVKYAQIVPFLAGINLIIFFGHFLDASATFIAIDYYNYTEKHVLPVFLIEIFQTAAVMYILKAIIIIIFVYFIDILYKKDFQSNPTLTGLLKIAILVLGLAPGTRDILRLTIGV